MINEKEDEKKFLNNSELKLDRGFELMLRKQNSKRRENPLPKTFQITFGKMISLLSREIRLNFDFSIDIKKK
jgi:hypothetical protein